MINTFDDNMTMATFEDYVPGSDSLDDGSTYDDGVNDFYLGDMEEDYPHASEFDCE